MGTKYKGTVKEEKALSAYINLMRAAQTVESAAQQHLDRAGLTLSQFGVLEALFHLGPLSQRELGGKILKSRGNMTMVVNHLERDGWVLRKEDPEDARKAIIHMTASGRRAVKRLLPGHVREIVTMMSVLTGKEQDELRQVCRKFGTDRAEKKG